MPDNQTGKDLIPSQRFTEAVIRQYSAGVGDLMLNDFQKELVQHYFIKADAALRKAEQDRLARNEWADQKNDLPIVWNNVNMEQLALDVVHSAKLGLDPTMKNHLSLVPYKNSKAQKYDITFIPGYEGKQYLAFEMALERPTAMVYDLVFSNDRFTAKMKSLTNPVESYELDIPNPFDRGTVVGGFGYIMYADPSKNKLIIMSKKDIDKRRPSYASPEFWGGKKKQKVNGKWEEVEIAGWYEEMALKTVIRHTCDQITMDPRKVNSSYLYMQQRQDDVQAAEIIQDIEENANSGPVVDVPSSEQQPAAGQQTIPGRGTTPDWAK